MLHLILASNPPSSVDANEYRGSPDLVPHSGGFSSGPAAPLRPPNADRCRSISAVCPSSPSVCPAWSRSTDAAHYTHLHSHYRSSTDHLHTFKHLQPTNAFRAWPKRYKPGLKESWRLRRRGLSGLSSASFASCHTAGFKPKIEIL